MKLKMYMDVWLGWRGEYANATSNPSAKVPTGFKRLSFVVEVPDHLIEPVSDFRIQETSIAAEVK